MKLLNEISQSEYDLGRDMCHEPETIAEKTYDTEGVLYVARFLAPGQVAVEGLVSVLGVYEDDTIRFRLTDDDGEPKSDTTIAKINGDGVLGPLTLRDVRVINAQEGYFQVYGNELNDEFDEMMKQLDQELARVNVTMGGEAGDAARNKRQLEIQETSSDDFGFR
jgi:hypothetical protein